VSHHKCTLLMLQVHNNDYVCDCLKLYVCLQKLCFDVALCLHAGKTISMFNYRTLYLKIQNQIILKIIWSSMTLESIWLELMQSSTMLYQWLHALHWLLILSIDLCIGIMNHQDRLQDTHWTVAIWTYTYVLHLAKWLAYIFRINVTIILAIPFSYFKQC
jgi:hypothetical protein